MTSSLTAKPCLRLDGWLYGRELDRLNTTALTLQKLQVKVQVFLKAITRNIPSRADRRGFLATQLATAPAAVCSPRTGFQNVSSQNTLSAFCLYSLTHSANFVSLPFPPHFKHHKSPDVFSRYLWALHNYSAARTPPPFKCAKVNNIPEEMHAVKSN